MQAALFDFDGTLADSMWVWDRLLPEFIETFQLPMYEGILEEVCHMSPRQAAGYIKERYGLFMSAKEIHRIWMETAYHAYKNEVILKPGAKEYLNRLREVGVRLAIVTACDAVLLTACLESNGVRELFDTIVYVDDVGKGKDVPDVYIEALRRLHTAPEQAVLFEDIPVVLQTGKNLGMFVIGVLGGDQEREMRAIAHRCIYDFHEL